MEYHRNVDPASWDYQHQGLGGSKFRQGGSYTPEQIVKTAAIFAAFLDGEKAKERK
jgi:hypothetical protein